eukprot:TRINITY_DN3452_c0_g1_i1.p1 TRINITY_DN3452_c0_g1~~TRINITY_DN3452_c0_g1_i1.p1  ORF type:complete len:167 (+),score=55.90 TRINITY_DN3452_c0_g1_i1:58-558(+)
MMMLVTTSIDGAERRKKVTVGEPVNAGSVRKAVEAAFFIEGLGRLTQLSVLDAASGEYSDVAAGTAFGEKPRLRAEFASDADKTAELEQRLHDLEANMRVVGARRKGDGDRSSTRSQRSACSDAVRRQKCEERMVAGITPDNPMRAAIREERDKFWQHELTAGQYF